MFNISDRRCPDWSSVLPVDDGADEDVAEDADHEDDGLEERPDDGVVARVVLGVLAPWVKQFKMLKCYVLSS